MKYEPGKILYDTETMNNCRQFYEKIIADRDRKISETIQLVEEIGPDQHLILSTIDMLLGWLTLQTDASAKERVDYRHAIDVLTGYLTKHSDIK